jgi:hypothetical protein
MGAACFFGIQYNMHYEQKRIRLQIGNGKKIVLFNTDNSQKEYFAGW